MSLSSLFYEPLDPKDAPPAAKALYEHVKDKPLHNDAILEAIPQFYSGWKRLSFVLLLDYLTQMGYTHTLTPEDCLKVQAQAKAAGLNAQKAFVFKDALAAVPKKMIQSGSQAAAQKYLGS